MIPGQEHFPPGEDVRFSRIVIGAAWPAQRPGFAVVVGEHKIETRAGLPLLFVLDEVSQDRLWELVEKLAALRAYYHPEYVWVDAKDPAAMQFCARYEQAGLCVRHAMLCAMDGPLAYAMPVLRQIRQVERLVLPAGSLLAGEMHTVPAHENLSKLHLVDYPAVAALAFAVLGLEQTRQDAVDQGPVRIADRGRILP